MRDVDANVSMSSDMGAEFDLSGADQKLFDDRQLRIACGAATHGHCGDTRYEMSIETDSLVQIEVELHAGAQPETATIVQFTFVDSMGIDLPVNSVDGVEIQSRSVATDEDGRAAVRLMTGFDETDVTVRASIPGLAPVEWVVEVRRVQAGTLEVDTRYQPGSQAQGNSLFDTVSVLLLEDEGEDAACDGFRNAPGTLAIHAVREASTSFVVTADDFRGLVVFNSTDSGRLYTAVALVRDQEDRLVGFGCISGVAVEPEETNRYELVIENVEIPLDYKGRYRMRLRLDLSDILSVNSDSLSEDNLARLGRSMLFESFRHKVFQFGQGEGDRARLLKDLFCDFISFEGEQCSQVESYIVRGLLGPLIDDVIASEGPEFFEAMTLYSKAINALKRIEVDAYLNIINASPDSFGFLRANDIHWSKIRLVRGDACSAWGTDSENCEWRWFPIHELHLNEAGEFFPVRALVDGQASGLNLAFRHHEMELHFGLIVTKLLEAWFYPAVFSVLPNTSIQGVLREVLPCLPVDQFVGDEPFCEPFLITNIEFILRTMLSQYNFGGFNLGFAGSGQVVDRDGDKKVDGFTRGVFQVYLPELAGDLVDMEQMSPRTNDEEERDLLSRQTPLIKTCFTACRCLLDPCRCEP
ncbi:MAG: hypothetical protein ACPGQS_08535, partial [Bradymonadia bacterium]